MAVFWVVLTSKHPRTVADLAFPFEVPDCADPAAFAALPGPLVAGERLSTVEDGRGRRMVQGRQPIAVGLGAIAQVTAYGRELWEPED